MSILGDQTYNVLFLCTGNSARSILAEAILNDASVNKGRFKAFSAGSFPKGVVNPFALELLRQKHLPTDNLRSKRWDEFDKPGAPELQFVITVCDQAAGEACPIWPGHPMTAHWGLPDPAAVEGDDAAKRRAFLEAYTVLERRIGLFASLPIEALDRSVLQQRMQSIGKQ